jgi:hypothetical protein
MAMRARLLATCHCMLRRSDTHFECHKYQMWFAGSLGAVCCRHRWQQLLLQQRRLCTGAWCSPVTSSHHSVYGSSSHVST